MDAACYVGIAWQQRNMLVSVLVVLSVCACALYVRVRVSCVCIIYYINTYILSIYNIYVLYIYIYLRQFIRAF
jgi:hypothetical protein